MRERFHVITGGPGAGKSALVDHLAGQGFACMPEAGRAIIRDQVAIGGGALPWADRLAFAEAMLARELRSWREAGEKSGSVLFDRGLPDVIGYLELCGLPVADHLRRAAALFRYNRRVFLAPHWPAIYRGDQERKQSPQEAEETCRAVAAAYAALGYELVPLPLASVKDRADFVMASL